jgi:hypothetical protein
VGLNELKLKNHRIGDTNRKSEEGERKAWYTSCGLVTSMMPSLIPHPHIYVMRLLSLHGLSPVLRIQAHSVIPAHPTSSWPWTFRKTCARSLFSRWHCSNSAAHGWTWQVIASSCLSRNLGSWISLGVLVIS